jgi:hypothetical protein
MLSSTITALFHLCRYCGVEERRGFADLHLFELLPDMSYNGETCGVRCRDALQRIYEDMTLNPTKLSPRRKAMAQGFKKTPQAAKGSGTHGATKVVGSGKGNTVGKTTVKHSGSTKSNK